ncbi:TIGR03986 family CRISPR-associated RAMP protein [Scytonema sp. UIC 10036]|uniref:TIGR03986 family type III CRISPR-associated RAMP protein n=1 Tax=Scytonema sp. UIC 10036 TaxID=2304196 RepID=UPI0012DA5D03|nr:TIGR03986 family CRISPR-associated RAMP protein [Scytonema sp. UIC 10036]MUH01330.1 TIGR03986 family CRISPR-associated RAMP protein [Scytonema sp. UIC 10036]
MLPRHLTNVPDTKKAIAPYNFIELPNDIVEIQADSLPSHNVYYAQSEKRYTGRIDCTLTTESPLYIRCGLTKEEFVCGAESKDLPDFFYTETASKAKKPVIPGSSLRGMLRILIEIISFSKMELVSDKKRFFFRAVAAKKDDPLGSEYKKLLKNVKAGYLVKEGDNWYIQPAKMIEKSSIIWVKEQDLAGIQTLIRMNQKTYVPQYIDVSFGDTLFKSPRRFSRQVSANQKRYRERGVLVTSGNMLESSDDPTNLRRRNHCIVPEINHNIDRISISDDAVQHYRSALTEFQKLEPFDKDFGVLKEGRPIFYCEPQSGQTEVTLFGHCPNFRIPYSPLQDGKAASAVDFIPENIGKSNRIDLAEAIFGFVRSKEKNNQSNIEKSTNNKFDSALAGRIFIENAICEKTINDDIWLTGSYEKTITPKILSNPKPTTFQHYLVQTSSEKIQLKHYANKSSKDNQVAETVIRGHKLYWHKGNNPDIEHPDGDNADGTQITKIKPIKEGVKFTFDIHFENITDIELGAILWILQKAAEPKYCLSLGMGKPLGMGAVKIEHQLLLNNRQERYSKLFSSSHQWLSGEDNQSKTDSILTDCINAFEQFIVNNIHLDDHPEGYNAVKLDDIPRIQMLLLMLRCDRPPSSNDTRYMTIEAKEYINRPVLPTPFQVMGKSGEDKRRLRNTSNANLQNSKTNISAKASQQFKVGQILDATVSNIKGVKVTYQLPDGTKKTTKEDKIAKILEAGQNIKVKVTAVKDDGSIKNVKYHE